MPSLKSIRKRISSVKSTQKITRAMKMVAGARLNRAQQRIVALRPYAVKTQEVLGSVVALAGAIEPVDGVQVEEEALHPLLQRKPEKRVLYLLVTSDRGLCGGFNAQLNKTAERLWHEAESAGKQAEFYIIGRKGREYLKRRNAPVKHTFSGVWEKLDMAQARAITETILKPFKDGEVDAIYVIFNAFKSAMTQEVTVDPLLPVRRDLVAKKPQERGEALLSTEYLFEPDRGALLDRLVPMYLEISILRALYESQASELGARMTAMDSATKNAKEMISLLTLQYNRARQAAITKELMEIIGGAEALKELALEALLLATPARANRGRVYRALKPFLFRIDPAKAHSLAMTAMGIPEHASLVRRMLAPVFVVRDPSLEVRTMGLTFPNPIGVAGGFDKEGKRSHALAALGFGHLELGTVTAIAQAENPPPNMFRLPADRSLVNRLGFPNRGARALAERLRERTREVPVGVSIGKSRVVDVEDTAAVVRDYETSFETVRDVADFLVVNISSPNTPNLRAMQRADAAETLLTALVRARSKGRHLPMLLKVAPDLDDEGYGALLDVVARVGFDGVIAANTTIRRDGLSTPSDVVSRIGAGGLSGPLLFPRALAMVKRARETLGSDATVIGVGGISTADHVRQMRDAGANLCQLYTAFIYEGPRLARRICEGLLRR